MGATPAPNDGQRRRSNEEALKDFSFYTDNYDSLVAQYTGQWIAVYGEQVVASSPDFFEMESQVEGKGIAFNETIQGDYSGIYV
jgi:hypothetical protein